MRHECVCFIAISFSIGYLSAAIHSLDVKCRVDYRGVVLFDLILPQPYTTWTQLNPKLYYRNGVQSWRQETSCVYTKKTEYQCAMHELTNTDRSLVQRSSDYSFRLETIEKTSLANITRMYFTDTDNETVAPWRTVQQVTYCENSIGVKYMAAHSARHTIDVEWIRFPLDVDFLNNFKSKISIEGAGITQENHVEKTKEHCHEDICTYKFQSLTACSNYKICVKTNDNLEKEHQKKCVYIRTYCAPKKRSSKWQVALLCVFGSIIFIVCGAMLCVLFNKYSPFSSSPFSSSSNDGIIPRIEIVNEEDLLNPVPMINITDNRNSPDVNQQHLYHYPYIGGDINN